MELPTDSSSELGPGQLQFYLFSHIFSLIPKSFLKGLDCILSRFKLFRLSLSTDTRAVVEGVSYPIIADLDTLPADCPILNVITIPEVITLGIIQSFLSISSSLGSKGFPA